MEAHTDVMEQVASDVKYLKSDLYRMQEHQARLEEMVSADRESMRLFLRSFEKHDETRGSTLSELRQSVRRAESDNQSMVWQFSTIISNFINSLLWH